MNYRKGRWTNEEVLSLLNHYNEYGPQWVADKLNRKYESVRDKAHQIGIKTPRIVNKFTYASGNADIAYILGIYLTDGTAYKSNGAYYFAIKTVDLPIAEKVRDTLKGLFGKEPIITKYEVTELPTIAGTKVKSVQPYYRVRVQSKELVTWLKRETQNKTILPDFVFKESESWKREFLSGLMDGDGWCTLINDSRCNSVYLVGGLVGESGGYIESLPRFLDTMGIHHKIRTKVAKKQGYKNLRIISFNTSTLISGKIRFYCTRKQKRIEQYLSLCSETKRQTLAS